MVGVPGDDLITKIYFSAYYEKDVNFDSAPFTSRIVVYSNTTEMSRYDYKNELNGSVSDNIKQINVTETK
jgi:hypothetical protein